ncbi:MAG: 2-dehydro-3-deoxy-D-gluconate 5-dehydrogenase KduD [Bryobacteraceae bacterium]
MFRLDGKVALVTGSNRGMGAAMALGFARAGANVVLHDIAPPEETAKRIREETSVRTHCLAADLSSRAQADRLIGEAVAAMGAVDILVNNAGIIRRAPAAEHGDEDWDAVIEINLTAVFRLCRAAGAHMLPRGRGKIVNIASLLAFQGGINVPSYAAAKGGVAQITKALANEWAGRGVNVNAIAPGYMRTENTRPLFQNEERRQAILERIPAGRWGEPEDVCGAAVFLASAAADYVHGHVLVVDGGWMAR